MIDKSHVERCARAHALETAQHLYMLARRRPQWRPFYLAEARLYRHRASELPACPVCDGPQVTQHDAPVCALGCGRR